MSEKTYILTDSQIKQIRADAIDDFSNKLITEFNKQIEEYRSIRDWSASFGMSQAKVIVEELKELNNG